MNKIVTIGLGAAAVVVALVFGAQLLNPPGGIGGPGNETSATPTIQPSPRTSAGFVAFTSRIHDISIDYPAGWQLRAATEPWTGGALDFDSPAADVIFDPARGDARYIVLASQPGRVSQHDHQSDQSDLIEDSAVCDPQGGWGGGSITVDGARAWGQTCDPGIDGAASVYVVAVTTDTGRYLFVLVGSDIGSRIGGYDNFDALLETVDLRPDEGG
jgi:hypothetical protein